MVKKNIITGCGLVVLLGLAGLYFLFPGNVADYERLLDFVFVKKPFIPLPIKRFLIREAVAHQALNTKIFKQLHAEKERAPLEEVLKALPVKTLVVWGAQDRVLHVSGAGILKAVMPGTRVEVMAAAGHLPMIEYPEKTAGLYRRFLANN